MHVATVLLSDPRPVKPAACLRHEPVQVPVSTPLCCLSLQSPGSNTSSRPYPLTHNTTLPNNSASRSATAASTVHPVNISKALITRPTNWREINSKRGC